MRRAAGMLLVCVVVAGPVAGCSAQLSRQGGPGDGAASAPALTGAPVPAPADAPPLPSSPTTASSPPPPTATSSLGPARTDVPDAALLPAVQDVRVRDAVSVVAWGLPQGCPGTGPSAATAMRTVTDRDGRAGEAVRVQQVVTFADVEGAVAEADRLAEVMDRCARDGGAGSTSGPVAVGAQGYGLARDPAGSPSSSGSSAALTRRGNALTLLSRTGRATAEGSRRAAVADAQAAWERLCLYDRTAGCPAG